MKIFATATLALLAAAATPALAAAPALNAKALANKIAASPTAATTQTTSFEIFLPLRNKAALQQLLADQQTVGSPSYHKWLTPAEFADKFGPTKASLDRAVAAAKAAGLSVTRTSGRSFHVSASVGTLNAAFKTKLVTLTHPDGTKALAASQLTLPAGLKAEGARVLSFSGAPPAHPMVTSKNIKVASPDNRYGPGGQSLWYNDLKQAYDYPAYNSQVNGHVLDGTGVHVAVLMEDLVDPADVAQFFNHENFKATTGNATTPTFNVETVTAIGTTGTLSGPGRTEATLDVEQVLGGAPGASVTLVSLPSLDNDYVVEGYQQIVNDNKYDLVNSSFGECELFFTAAYGGSTDGYIDTLEEVFQQGNAQGITFVASSGDEGGLECPNTAYFGITDGVPAFVPSVSSPADSPEVTGVGGTNLITTADPTNPTPPYSYNLNSAYVSENGYGDPEQPQDPYGTGNILTNGYWGAGGGISVLFPRPIYQTLVNSGSANRTVPDVGMQVGGCPGSAIAASTGCGGNRSAVIVTGNLAGAGILNYSVIGTSVSSPEFVGAVALYEQKNGGRQGNINTYLYHFGATQTKLGGIKAPAAGQFYHRDIPGYDGVYSDTQPSVNYNYIVGNGTPDVRKLFGFQALQPAGVPRTPSNP